MSLLNHTEEQEDEETLKSIEDHKGNFEGSGNSSVSKPNDSKCTKEPCQAKEKHDTYNTDDDFLVHLFFGTTMCIPNVLNKYPNHHDKG